VFLRNHRNLLSLVLLLVILPLLTNCALFVSADGRLRLFRIYFAKEVVAEIYTVPPLLTGEPHVSYQQSVYRSANRHFFLRLTLLNGAKFSATGAEPELTFDLNAGGLVAVNRLLGAAAEQTYAEWIVNVLDDFTETGDGPPRWNIDLTGVAIDAGQVLQNGGSVDVMVSTRDSAAGVPFDSALTGKFMVGVPGVAYIREALVTTSALVNMDEEEKEFVPNGTDTPTVDNGADAGEIGPGLYFEEEPGEDTPEYVCVFAPDGNPYFLSADDSLDLVFRSNLSAISQVVIGPSDAPQAFQLSDEERASNSLTLTVPGDVVTDWSTVTIPSTSPILPGVRIPIAGFLPISFEVVGDQPIRTRILTVELRIRLENGQEYQLLPPTEITRWLVDGSVLVAPWVNGNDSALGSMISLINHSPRDGRVKVRVLALPRVGPAIEAQDLGSVPVGILRANGAASINVAEQVLQPLGLRPYTENGGNVSLEITIAGADVSGLVNVSGSGMSYGVSELIKSQLGVVD